MILHGKILRETIADLKKNNDFRQEGAKDFAKSSLLIHTILLLILLSAAYALWPSPEEIAFSLAIFILVEALLWKYLRGKMIAVVSVGTIGKGTITRSYYEGYGRSRWRIRYEFLDNSGNKFDDKISLLKRFIPDSDPKNGDEVTVFYDSQNPKENFLYVPYFFTKSCVSKSRFSNFKNKPFVRRQS